MKEVIRKWRNLNSEEF